MHYKVATALTVYGIETTACPVWHSLDSCVATALTVYGIETRHASTAEAITIISCNSPYRLRY